MGEFPRDVPKSKQKPPEQSSVDVIRNMSNTTTGKERSGGWYINPRRLATIGLSAAMLVGRTGAIDTSQAHKETEYPSLVRRWDGYSLPPLTELVSNTSTAKIYAASTGNSIGNDSINAANAVAQTIEKDNAKLANIFDGTKLDNLPFKAYTMPLPEIVEGLGLGSNDSNITFAAYHEKGNSTMFISADQYSSGNAVAEMTEVYESEINNGWDSDKTNGEALSRVLAWESYPNLRDAQRYTERDWLNSGAVDYISNNNATDRNQDANGCGTLFLGYLHDGLGHSWEDIVKAGGSTLAETYSKLTGDASSNAFQNFKKALEPFIAKDRWPPIGEPWYPQANTWRKGTIAGSVVGGVGVLGTVGGLLYRRRRRLQSAHGDANSSGPENGHELDVRREQEGV